MCAQKPFPNKRLANALIRGNMKKVGTNHFGHFYLNSLLLPKVAKEGKIVVTASGVHDPESPGGAQGVPATLGEMEGLEKEGRYCEMIDGGKFNADKAYKDSKLCNVLFTRELQKRLESQDSSKGIIANCFNPGLIVSTGLFRDQNPFFTKVFDFAATDLIKVGETPPWGGGCLSYMINEVRDRGAFYSSAPGSSKYGSAAYGQQFAACPVSKEAQDDVKAKRLWYLTEEALKQLV
jgi:protochlorophyllide reductase